VGVVFTSLMVGMPGWRDKIGFVLLQHHISTCRIHQSLPSDIGKKWKPCGSHTRVRKLPVILPMLRYR